MREISQEVINYKIEQINNHWTKKVVNEEWTAFKKRKYFHLFFPIVSNFKLLRAVVLMGPRRVGKNSYSFSNYSRIFK